MSFILSFLVISAVSFAAFCFYCGVSTIGEKLKKDGFRAVLEVAVLAFAVTAIVLYLTSKVGDQLFRSAPNSADVVKVIRT